MTSDNKNLYNGGSECQNNFGNLPDYYQTFYRSYDAALGRFTGVDPSAGSAATEFAETGGGGFAGSSNGVFGNSIGSTIFNAETGYGSLGEAIGLINNTTGYVVGSASTATTDGHGTITYIDKSRKVVFVGQNWNEDIPGNSIWCLVIWKLMQEARRLLQTSQKLAQMKLLIR